MQVNTIKGDGITQCFIRAYDGEGKWDEYIANEPYVVKNV